MSEVLELGGKRVLTYVVEAGSIADPSRALDLIAAASSADADWVVLSVEGLAGDFFSLRSGIAGEFVQKFVNYGRRLAIVGDVSRHVEASTAFRDFVREANRGAQLWFVADVGELGRRLEDRRIG